MWKTVVYFLDATKKTGLVPSPEDGTYDARGRTTRITALLMTPVDGPCTSKRWYLWGPKTDDAKITIMQILEDWSSVQDCQLTWTHEPHWRNIFREKRIGTLHLERKCEIPTLILFLGWWNVYHIVTTNGVKIWTNLVPIPSWIIGFGRISGWFGPKSGRKICEIRNKEKGSGFWVGGTPWNAPRDCYNHKLKAEKWYLSYGPTLSASNRR